MSTLKISLENFRGFKKSGSISIRPITLLVGENSAGKTSFLAAARYMLKINAFVSASSLSFNQPPFFLGGFSDIAHSRIGRSGGAAKSFVLKVERTTSKERSTFSSIRPRELPERYSLSLEFSELLGQAAFKRVGVVAKDKGIEIDFLRSSLTLRQQDETQNVVLPFSEKFAEQLKFVRKNPNGLGVIFSQLQTLTFGQPLAAKDFARPIFKENVSDNDLSKLEAYSVIFDTAYHAVFDQNTGPDRSVVALSPIRNEPRRIYEVVDMRESPTGDHVPIRLAQQKAENIASWKAQNSYISDFGRKAGLFSAIDIRRLGRTQNDPFQIVVSVSGKKRNIMDVGYGVSQVLPLVYEMSEKRFKKRILIQQPEVHLHPRAQAEIGSLVVEANKGIGHQFLIETHSDYIIDRIRNHIRLGNIPTEDVALLYFDRQSNETHVHEITLDERGDIVNPPENYRDFFYREEKKLLGI